MWNGSFDELVDFLFNKIFMPICILVLVFIFAFAGYTALSSVRENKINNLNDLRKSVGLSEYPQTISKDLSSEDIENETKKLTEEWKSRNNKAEIEK